jgi:hypothetical protein
MDTRNLEQERTMLIRGMENLRWEALKWFDDGFTELRTTVIEETTLAPGQGGHRIEKQQRIRFTIEMSRPETEA